MPELGALIRSIAVGFPLRRVLSSMVFAFCALMEPMSAAAASSSKRSVGEFRGYIVVNQLLRDRLMEDGAAFELGHYVGEGYTSYGTNLLDLLGTHKTGSSGGRLRNGAPNALNMLLWHLLFSGLASDLGRVCQDEGSPLALRSEVLEKTRAFCSWPSGASRSDAALLGFWLALIGYDAPISEFYAWKEFAQAPEMDRLDGSEAIQWMALTIFNNPYFLLRQ